MIHHTRIDHHSHKPKKTKQKSICRPPGPWRRACRPLHMAARGSGGLLGRTRAPSPSTSLRLLAARDGGGWPARRPAPGRARPCRRLAAACRPATARASRGSPARSSARPHQRGRASWPRVAAAAAGPHPPPPAPGAARRPRLRLRGRKDRIEEGGEEEESSRERDAREKKSRRDKRGDRVK